MAAPKKQRKPAPKKAAAPAAPAVRRRRRDTARTAPPPPPTRPDVVNANPAADTLDNGEGVSLEKDALAFYCGHPLMERRRLHFDSQELIQLIGESLIRKGLPKDKLNHTRWLWVGNRSGCPELFLILPGAEA